MRWTTYSMCLIAVSPLRGTNNNMELFSKDSNQGPRDKEFLVLFTSGADPGFPLWGGGGAMIMCTSWARSPLYGGGPGPA